MLRLSVKCRTKKFSVFGSSLEIEDKVIINLLISNY